MATSGSCSLAAGAKAGEGMGAVEGTMKGAGPESASMLMVRQRQKQSVHIWIVTQLIKVDVWVSYACPSLARRVSVS